MLAVFIYHNHDHISYSETLFKYWAGTRRPSVDSSSVKGGTRLRKISTTDFSEVTGSTGL